MEKKSVYLFIALAMMAAVFFYAGGLWRTIAFALTILLLIWGIWQAWAKQKE